MKMRFLLRIVNSSYKTKIEILRYNTKNFRANLTLAHLLRYLAIFLELEDPIFYPSAKSETYIIIFVLNVNYKIFGKKNPFWSLSLHFISHFGPYVLKAMHILVYEFLENV